MESQAMNPKRFYFFDNLKAFIVLLMVVFHIGMGYTTWDLAWWTVNDRQKHIVFDYFILATDVYIMPVMFLAAGYFAPVLLVRKGLGVFWRDKLRRIVIPWIGGVLFIAPLIAYSNLYSRMAIPPDFWDFWRNGFWGPYYQQGHFWFLGILTLFFLLLTLFHRLRPSFLSRPRQNSSPALWFFPLFTLLTAACFFSANLYFWNDTWMNATYLFMIQPVRLLLHLCYFGLGIYAWKQSWLTPGGYSPRLIPWCAAAISMLAVFLLYRVSFTLMPEVPLPAKAGHALCHAAFALTATFALLALFQHYVDSSTYLWRRLAANSYIIYFIHQCIVIPIACLVQLLEINIWLKYAGVCSVALILCFLLAEYVIQPVLTLGKKRKPIAIAR
ncbi:MAG: acyltransferase family protein [Sporomusaceae bacterium]|nr:acyltransferase family protein [Sporomusaceae bacterium]